MFRRIAAVLALGFCFAQTGLARLDDAQMFLVKAKAVTKEERNQIVNAGIAIDRVLSDQVTFMGTRDDIARVKKLGIKVEATNAPERSWDFPSEDAKFHNYAEMNAALDEIVKKHPKIATKEIIGKSLEGKDLVGIRLSSNPKKDSLPTALFYGCHHAREHLSVEVPLMLAQHLAENYAKDKRIRELLDTREVYITPMVNPDGAEHDISNGSYRYWRKNRRDNGDGTFGVDLNRNYGGKGWGGEGSSDSTSSDIYHGPEAFSEPETQAVRDFTRARKMATILLSFHTYSELVLWPWGHTDDVISNDKDRNVYETMGKRMAKWNKYTPQKSSELYVASGDTTDWAYDELKMFAFTFELSPSSMFGGGFYPGAEAIEPTFKANIEPALYLIEHAKDPYGVLNTESADPLNIL